MSHSGGILGGIHWRAALAGYSAGSTGEPLWRDTRRDPLASCSGGILGGIHWRAALAGYWAGSTGEQLWRATRRDPCSGGILGGIHWQAALAGYWVGACRSISNADSNIKPNNPFPPGGKKGGRKKKKKLKPPRMLLANSDTLESKTSASAQKNTRLPQSPALVPRSACAKDKNKTNKQRRGSRVGPTSHASVLDQPTHGTLALHSPFRLLMGDGLREGEDRRHLGADPFCPGVWRFLERRIPGRNGEGRPRNILSSCAR